MTGLAREYIAAILASNLKRIHIAVKAVVVRF